MKTTLTVENLLTIVMSLDKIAKIDRSDYFNQYYNEVLSRLRQEVRIKHWVDNPNSGIDWVRTHERKAAREQT